MYAPNNVSVFTAAFAGATSGMGVGAAVLTDPTEADYNPICTIGLAFAESFDTQWQAAGPPGVNTLVIDMIQSCCEESFAGRPCHPVGPPLTVVSNWTQLSNAIIALVRAGSDTVTGQGITPVPFPASGGALVTTPNLEHTIASFLPGVAGRIVAVADITPVSSGDVFVNANLSVNADAVDVPAMVLFYIADLTAVTGGTPIVSPHPGITELPTSTTPVATTGVVIFATEEATFVDSNAANAAVLQIAGAPVKAPVGHRAGFVLFAKSNNEGTHWVSGLSMSVSER